MAALLPIAALTACQNNALRQEETPPVEVTTISAGNRTHCATYRYSGTVEESTGTELSFPVPGTIKDIYATPGRLVKKGQMVARLDPTSAQSSHDAAMAALRQAEDACNRMKVLHDKGSLPEAQWVEVQSKLQQARSMEEIARKNLADCNLYAPFDGVVSKKSVEVGQNVLPGIPVARIVTASQLKVKIAVPETEISDISIGSKAIIAMPALGGKTIGGKVEEKGIAADPLSRSYEVKIRLTDTPQELMPGMITEVSLYCGNHADTARVIPANVVMLDENNRTFVWVANHDKAEKRMISCGEYTADGVTVTSGLTDGDPIIAKGTQKVCEGTPISPIGGE